MRYTKPVRFIYSGDKHAAQRLCNQARTLIGKTLKNPVGDYLGRKQHSGRFKFSDGTLITVQQSFGVLNCYIYVPLEEDKEDNNAAFVVYPYTGWMYPAYLDRRPTGASNTTVETQPAYYTKKQEVIPTKPYWLDTKRTYKETQPTAYSINRIRAKDADIKYDPMYAQFLDDDLSWDKDEDDQYSNYGHWRSGSLVDTVWIPGDWHLHWQDRPTGSIVDANSLAYTEQGWGKFIYVNGVKFHAPGYVRGGGVYHHTETNSDWLLVSTWTGELQTQECLHDVKANIWMTRLTTNEGGVPTATNDGETVITTDLYNAILVGTPDPKELSYNWFPLDDIVDGFTIPNNATNKGSYSSTCGTGFEGEKYLNSAFGFKFNQDCDKLSYVAVIEGATANEFNEFTLNYIINETDGYLIPDTFSKTLTASDYVTTTIQDEANEYDGNWHDYQSNKMYVGIDYKENVLQKLQGTIRAKFILFADKTDDFRETYVDRNWYINDVLLGSQSLSKVYTGLNYADRVWVSTEEVGDYYLYYDLISDNYVKESYTMDWDTGDTYLLTYNRSIVISGITISVDSGNHTATWAGYGGYQTGWPLDDYSEFPWKMNGSINALVSGYSGGKDSTNTRYFYAPLSSLYSDRIAVGYHWLGGGGVGHLTVHIGHEKEHIAGYFVNRSINAGANGIYYTDAPSPWTYTFEDTDHRFRVKQHLFVLNLNNADKLYAKYGVKEDTSNHTVPVINTCFYRRYNRWNKH